MVQLKMTQAQNAMSKSVLKPEKEGSGGSGGNPAHDMMHVPSNLNPNAGHYQTSKKEKKSDKQLIG